MVSAPRKFTAVATALVVLVAHALCLCRTATAVPVTQPAPAAAHHCCKHEAPEESPAKPGGHSRDGEGHCRHCDGFAAPLAKAGDQNAGHVLALQHFSVEIAPGLVASLQPSLVDSHVRRAEFFASPTLLRLSCALNL